MLLPGNVQRNIHDIFYSFVRAVHSHGYLIHIVGNTDDELVDLIELLLIEMDDVAPKIIALMNSLRDFNPLFRNLRSMASYSASVRRICIY